MTPDLPRIGKQPDCEYPKCPLLARTRTFDSLWNAYRLVCSLHTDWDGDYP